MIVARGPLAVRHRSPASFRGTLTMAAVTGLAMYDDAQKAGNEIRIEDHASLVKRIAYHMMLRMPASVQVDDLIQAGDRKSTRLNSSHVASSYAVCCLKNKNYSIRSE